MVALILWCSAVIAGRMQPVHLLMSLCAGVLLWGLYFALGFRAFSRGMQANGLGMVLTVALPLVVIGLYQLKLPLVACLLPPGSVFSATQPFFLDWIAGPILIGGATLWITRQALKTCDGELRRWYDRHAGAKVMT